MGKEENEIVFTNDEFYISYLQEPGDLAMALDELAAMGGRPAPTGQPETALVLNEPLSEMGFPRFLVLYGDHREAYRKLVPDLNR